MTRRPIFIGVATILTLALTAGMAYGAGRLVGTQTRDGRSARQQVVGATTMMPGTFSNHAQARQGSAFGSAFRSQMRAWMQDWMANHDWSGRSWSAGYGRQVTGRSTGATSAGYSNGSSTGYSGTHQTDGWNGPANGGYGCCGNGYGGGQHDDWHDCW